MSENAFESYKGQEEKKPEAPKSKEVAQKKVRNTKEKPAKA
eukprot:CAMPEP_0168621204 /NCGR_PEP_ID=MMETSP0449_2-20121227/7561_1 /TAXON_ID=1082188 /ORGANISM="Strombidium rassoulzadegani, Strain ras09" /LENGTH=40 /DNA_ID= /DNA_START= /DNA_END= /DNA_ORIENTATION=